LPFVAASLLCAQTQPAPPLSGVLGKVQSQVPSDLNHVTSNSYVGVPSVQQADGSQLAKQVIIFPKELRGAVEGSVLTDEPGATTHSRMTNGSVAKPAAPQSRMTNGSAEKGGGNTLVVRYQDGSQTISLRAGIPVTLVAKVPVTLGAGDVIYAPTEKLPDGTLTTNKIFQFIAASGGNGQ
jgi:hypothetical protein